MTFLTQSCDVYRREERGTGNDGLPTSAWSLYSEGVACRLMHDAAVAAGGNEGGSVKVPRCYFESDVDLDAADEIVVGGVRYAIEQLFGPAEGGDHYTVASLRSGAQV